MGKFPVTFFVLLITVCFYKVPVYAESAPVPEQQAKEVSVDEKSTADLNVHESESQEPLEPLNIELEVNFINDPLQPYNRSIFVFNDKMYYYFMKPVSNGYKTVVHEKVRLSIRNFLSNIRMPIRFVNCILQGKIEGATAELARFVINSIFGLGGFFDPASSSELNLKKYNEDFGQTLAKYGIGAGPYIEWPIIGPCNVRDTVGYVGDIALNPISLLSFFAGQITSFGVNAVDYTNEVSIDKGDMYESITKPAIDPYIALQDAYTQNRIKNIKE